ncbi:MAG: hypothetical protein ACI3YC_00825 [Alloprevotella sp.]
MEIDVTAPAEGTITVQSVGNSTTVVLAQKDIKDKDVVLVDVPQGIGNSFGVVFDDGIHGRQFRRVQLTGEPRQVESVVFDDETDQAPVAAAPVQRAATNSGLYGSSPLANCGYFNFGAWAWDDVALALKEAVNPARTNAAIIDYEIMAPGTTAAGGELISTEPVYLSFIYGHTGAYDSRILGYYTHTPGSYADIEYHDIANTHYYDYYDGKAKVQYQIDNVPEWKDANFDYKDGEGLPGMSGKVAGDSRRRGDDAYNTLLVNEAYGERITAMRGLTFKLDIPQGKAYGFYLTTNTGISADQKSRLTKLGVPADRIPAKTTNFSFAPMNSSGLHRSAIAIYDNFTFMGLDDGASAGDQDCNDVTFALSNSKGQKLRPVFTPETLESSMNQGAIEEHPEFVTPSEEEDENLQCWTLGFENAGMDVDFDFNDVVLKVKPDTKNHTVSVWLLAAGAERDTQIYYGETLLGEVHQLFDIKKGEMVNTKYDEKKKDPVLLADNLPWPEQYTMDTHRHLFRISVVDESGKEVFIDSSIMLGENHDVPQVLCVAGDWEWPLEKHKVEAAYPYIGEWGRNFSDKENWNWYSQPNQNMIYRRQ